MQIRTSGNRRRLALVFAVLMGMLVTGTALAAEFGEGEVYRLEADQVIEDDLYIAGSEVYIDGVVQGDLVAAGSYIEVNGTVTGDAMLAAAGIVINGQVQDDVRAAGAGIQVNGTIGDDLFAAGGGGGGSDMPMPGIEQRIAQGIIVGDRSSIGGDAVIAGGGGTIGGTIADDLMVGMGRVELAALVGGNAMIGGETITIRQGTAIAGELRYTSDEQITIPEGTAANVVYEPHAMEEEEVSDPVGAFLGWLFRTLMTLLGFTLLGWLAVRLAPGMLNKPVAAINQQPVRVGLTGFVLAVLFIFIPLASALLVFAMALFWGWFPGLLMGLLLFAALALLWFLSPLVTGLWVGEGINTLLKREAGTLPTLLVGVLVLVLLGSVPFLGWLVYLASFICATGALLVARRTSAAPPATAAPM